MSEYTDTAKQHIENVITWVLSVEEDAVLREIEAILWDAPEMERYQFVNETYTYRNLRDAIWGNIVGRIFRNDIVEITIQVDGWGQIGSAWLSGVKTEVFKEAWIYMSSMVKL